MHTPLLFGTASVFLVSALTQHELRAVHRLPLLLIWCTSWVYHGTGRLKLVDELCVHICSVVCTAWCVSKRCAAAWWPSKLGFVVVGVYGLLVFYVLEPAMAHDEGGAVYLHASLHVVGCCAWCWLVQAHQRGEYTDDGGGATHMMMVSTTQQEQPQQHDDTTL